MIGRITGRCKLSGGGSPAAVRLSGGGSPAAVPLSGGGSTPPDGGRDNVFPQ